MAKKKATDNKLFTKMREVFLEIYYNEIAPIMLAAEPERLIAYKNLPKSKWYEFNKIRKELNKNFATKLKHIYMPKISKAFGGLEYFTESEKVISNSEIIASRMFTFLERKDDDAFSGYYKGIKFEIIETKLGDPPRFEGIIIKFDTNKPIKHTTIITSKQKDIVWLHRFLWCSSILGFLISIGLIYAFPMINEFYTNHLGNPTPISIILAILSDFIIVLAPFGFIYWLFSMLLLALLKPVKELTLTPLKLEDVEFNKHFKAYSTDQVEGRYLITTTFMERFKKMQEAFQGTDYKCSFYKNSVLFAFATKKDHFEIGDLYTPLNTPKHMEKFFDELASILAMIDYFKLDEKTGL